MGLKQTGQGKWQIDYRLPNGKQRRETVDGDKKLEQAVLAKRRVQIAKGKFLNIKNQEKIRFQDFGQEFLNVYSNPNRKIWKSDEYHIRQNTITLLDTKNGEKRDVHMNEQVKTALIRITKHKDSPYIFCKEDGSTYTLNSELKK